jgi:hypothetical protein
MIDWLAALPPAVWLQQSGTAYLLMNAAHILGIGLILGAILPLDLRLMGAFPSVPVAVVGPFLSRSAALGVGLALVTGVLLFSVDPRQYLANPAFLAKVGIVALALVNVLVLHTGKGWQRACAGLDISVQVRAGAAFSAALWISALVAGRWIGFL